MRTVDSVKNKYRYELTQKATQYGWAFFDKDNWDYDYTDYDYATIGGRDRRTELGRPRRSIAIHRKPKNRKKKTVAFLEFDDFGEYTHAWVGNCGVSKKELQAWVEEALIWLEENGYIRKAERGNK